MADRVTMANTRQAQEVDASCLLDCASRTSPRNLFRQRPPGHDRSSERPCTPHGRAVATPLNIRLASLRTRDGSAHEVRLNKGSIPGVNIANCIGDRRSERGILI